MRSIFTLLVVLFQIQTLQLNAQISQRGIPYSLSSQNKSQALRTAFESKKVTLNKLDNKVLKAGAEKIKAECTTCRKDYYGKGVDVSIDIKRDGQFHDLGKDGNMWLLTVTSETALGMQFYFNKYIVPVGGNLYFYNESGSMTLGAFTSRNNNPTTNKFGTQVIKGSSITIEYVEPKNVTEPGVLSIGTIIHAFKDIYPTIDGGADDFGASQSCENDINCAKGAPYQDIKNGIVRISFFEAPTYYSALCTGSLINSLRNTAGSQPDNYVLTANHCLADYDYVTPDMLIFEFGYEIKDCENKVAPTVYSNTMSGATVISRGTASDYLLLNLSSAPPASYNPVYLGWDRSENIPTSGVDIHHPQGDVKKISFYSGQPSIVNLNVTYAGPGSTNPENGVSPPTFWKLSWLDGVTESVSSGSALFDQNKRIVGQLIGGNSFCAGPAGPDYFGRLAYSWSNPDSGYPTLGSFLDPFTTGALRTNTNNPSSTLDVSFTYAPDDSNPLSINFTGLSSQSSSVLSWNWNFGDNTGVITSTSPTPPPHLYASGADFTVTLQILTSTGQTASYSQQISVVPVVSSFVANAQIIRKGQSIMFTDLSDPFAQITSWTWWFEQPPALPNTANPVQNNQYSYLTHSNYLDDVSHTYNTGGHFQVRLVVTVQNGPTNDPNTTIVNYTSTMNVTVLETPVMVADFTTSSGGIVPIDWSVDPTAENYVQLNKYNPDTQERNVEVWSNGGNNLFYDDQYYYDPIDATGEAVHVKLKETELIVQRMSVSTPSAFSYRVVNTYPFTYTGTNTPYPANTTLPSLPACSEGTPQFDFQKDVNNNDLIVLQREGTSGFYLYDIYKSASNTWSTASVVKYYQISNEVGSPGKIFVDANRIVFMINGKIYIYNSLNRGWSLNFSAGSLYATIIQAPSGTAAYTDFSYSGNTIVATRAGQCGTRQTPIADVYDLPAGNTPSNLIPNARLFVDFDPDINVTSQICIKPNSVSGSPNKISMRVTITNGGSSVDRLYIFKKPAQQWMDATPSNKINTVDAVNTVQLTDNYAMNCTAGGNQIYRFSDYCEVFPLTVTANVPANAVLNDVVAGNITFNAANLTINSGATVNYIGVYLDMKPPFHIVPGANVTFQAVGSCDQLYNR